MTQKISAIIPTYNEEHNIIEAIESVSWADEVLVVDSFSTDQTVQLAKENGAIGGKVSGAGGGGFFTLYCEDKQIQLRSAMAKAGLRELNYNFDFEGTKVLGNFMSYYPDTIS